MKRRVRILCGALVGAVAACQDPVAAPSWDALEGIPDGFKDGTDAVRTDEEILAAVQGRFVTAEADPAFVASPAAGITSDQVAQWSASVEAGDHRAAGYLTSETDPAFLASPAAGVTADHVAQWTGAVAWGDHASAGYLKGEADPSFLASPAAGVTAEDVANWKASFEWGDHAEAGYLTTESEPAFRASAAAGVTADNLTAWNLAASWGSHATAGYLKTESDPAFTASAAASITTSKVSQWNTAFGWGSHATAGYLKTESDPKIGALTNGAVPTWDGSKLSLGSISENAGKVAVGVAPTSAVLTVSDVAKVGFPMVRSATQKSCATPGFSWTNTPPSATACNTYCSTRGFVAGRVDATGSRNAGGASCDYVSDFETCTVASMQNNGGCNSKATAFVCTCLEEGSEFAGHVRVVGGNLGVGVNEPRSPLHVNGYLQLGTTTGAPPVADCDETAERARMLIDPASGQLWICANSGWVAK